MALIRVNNPYVKNFTLRPSNIYAISPYRPYVGIYENPSNISSDQYNEQLIKALSPFSVNDPNVIKAIRRKYNIEDNGAYNASGEIGLSLGLAAGGFLSYGLYGGAVKTLASTLPLAFTNPISGAAWTIGALGTATAIAGTVLTTGELGKVTGRAIGSEEGSIALGRYFKNLGNSLVRRPITTVLNSLTIAGVQYGAGLVKKRFGLGNPMITQAITMGAMRLMSPIGEALDNSILGELNDSDQMTYTDLLQLQGDLADDFSGTTLVKGALASINGEENIGSDLIAKAYGEHKDGFDPLDFMDVRESWGIDIGSFGNGLIDILGEVAFDTDNIMNTVKNKTTTAISKATNNITVKSILADRNSTLFKHYFKEIDIKDDAGNIKKEIQARQSFKTDFENKQLQRITEQYLEDYIDPSLAKTEKEYLKIIENNDAALRTVTGDLYTSYLHKGIKPEEASKLITELKNKINESFKYFNKDIEKFYTSKSKYLSVTKQIVTAEKKSENIKNKIDLQDKLAKEGFKFGKYNFDKALLKEFNIQNFSLSKQQINRMLSLQPIFRTYVNGNNRLMSVLGYMTRPGFSIIGNKKIRKVIKRGLGKSLRMADPYEKVISIKDVMEKNAVITKEDAKSFSEELKKYKEVLKGKITTLENEAIQKYLNDPEFEKTLDRLEKIKNEEYKYNLIKDLSKKQMQELIKLNDSKKEAEKLLEEKRKEAIAKAIDNNKEFKVFMDNQKEISEKYKQLIDEETYLKMYENNMKYYYITNSNKRELRIVNDENYKLIEKEIKELKQLKNPSKLQQENLQQLENAFLYYVNSSIFKDGYTNIIKQHKQILSFLENFERSFSHDYYKIQTLNLTTEVFRVIDMSFDQINHLKQRYENKENLNASELKDIETILNFEKQREHIIDLEMDALKPEQTQEDVKELFKEKTLAAFNHPVKIIEYQLKKIDMFNEKIKQEIIDNFKNDRQVKLPLYYATNFFAVLKIDNNDKFFFNDRELFSALEQRIGLDLDLQSSLNELTQMGLFNYARKQIIFETKTTVEKESFRLAQTKLENIIEEMNGNILNESQASRLKNNSSLLLQKLIITQSRMVKDPNGIATNTYNKKFSKLTQNDMIDYVFQLAMKHDTNLNMEAKKVDNLIKEMDRQAQILKEKFIKNKFGMQEQMVHTVIKGMLSKLNKFKVINAINSKYVRDSSNSIMNIEYEKTQPIKIIDEESAKLINSRTYENKKISREIILKNLAEDLISYFNKSPLKKIMLSMGIKNSEIKKMIKDVTPRLTSKKINIDKLDETVLNKYYAFAEDIKNKIMLSQDLSTEQIKQQHPELDDLIFDFVDNLQKETNKYFYASQKIVKGPKKEFKSKFIQSIQNSIFGNLIDVSQLSKVLRGKVNKTKVKIDLNRSPFKASIIDFMETHEPTLENVLILKNQPFGTYKNFDGKPIMLQRISQIDNIFISHTWRKFIHEKLFSDASSKNLLEFFYGYVDNLETSQAYKKYLTDTISTPQQLRDYFKDKEISDIKKTETFFFDHEEIKDKTLIKDISKMFSEDKQIKNIYVSKESENIKGNLIKILRIKLINNEYYDFYIPSEKEKNTFIINDNIYIKQDVYLEDKNSLAYIKAIKDAFQKDFAYAKQLSGKQFTPYLVQKSIFGIFHEQRYLENTDDPFTNFIYIDKIEKNSDKPLTHFTDFTKLKFLNTVRLTKGQKRNIITHSDQFISEVIKNGYSLDAVGTDPKTIYKPMVIKDENGKKIKASLAQIFSVMPLFTERAQRSALALNARGNAKKLLYTEKPLLTSTHIKNNPELEVYDNIGVNAKTLLMDIDDLDLSGISTHNGTAIMSESFAKKIFGENNYSDGMKIIDRHSSKHAIRIVNDEKLIKYGSPELILSKSDLLNRGLYNARAEISINQDNTKRNFVDNNNRDIEYIKSLTEDGDIEKDKGYLYIYATDTLTDNNGVGYKVAGDKNIKDGAKLGMEEMQLLDSLRELTLNNKKIDPEGKVLEFFLSKSKQNEKELIDILYNEQEKVRGKEGKLRRNIIDKPILNSGYNKIISNTSLKNNEIKMPKKQLIAMGVLKKDGTFVSKESEYMLLHRFPTQGRRSFAFVKVLINEQENSKAIEINPYIETALNADYDGDGSAVYSLKGASEDVLKILEKAFSHDHNKFSGFSDEGLENEKAYSTGRSKEEVLKNEQKKMLPKFSSIEDNNNNLVNQKVLKEYSGLFKDIFDADYQDYISNEENSKWFNDFIKTNKDAKELNIRSFYGLTTMLYNFYSQKTFDFSKHGNKAQKQSFKIIYDAISKSSNETFHKHIERLLGILNKDMKYTAAFEKLIKTAKVTNEATTKYLNNIKKIVANFPKKLTEIKDEDLNLKNNIEEESNYKFETNTKTILNKLNNALKEYNVEFNQDDIKNLKEPSKEYALDKLDETYADHFNMEYFIGNKHQNQIFNFIKKTYDKNVLNKKIKSKQTSSILKPFYFEFQKYFAELYNRFNDNKINFLDDIKMIIIYNDGTEKAYTLSKLFKVSNATSKAIATSKNINKLIGPKLNAMALQFKPGFQLTSNKIKTFKFSANSSIEESFVRLTDNFYRNLSNKVSDWLEENGIARQFILNPNQHDKKIYEYGQFESIYTSIVNNQKNQSSLIDFLKDLQDDKTIEEIQNLLKPMILNQSLNEYIDGNKRIGLTEKILDIDFIIDPNELTYDTMRLETAAKLLIDANVFPKETGLTNFIIDAYSRIGETNLKNKTPLYEMISILKEIEYGLKNKPYHILQKFYNSTYEQKINYLTKIYNIRKGKFFDAYEKYQFKTEDLVNLPKMKNFTKENNNKLETIFDRVITNIEGSYLLENKDKLIESLKDEKENFKTVSKVISNLNKELSHYVTENIHLRNETSDSNGEYIYHLRSLLHPNDGIENYFILKNSKNIKNATNITQRFVETIYKKEKMDTPDTEFTNFFKEVSNNTKIANNILSLNAFDKGDIDSFIATLEKQLNFESFAYIPISENIMKYLLHLNKINKEMSGNQVISFSTVETYIRDINTHLTYNKEYNISQATLFKRMFFDYYTDLNQVKKESLDKLIDDFSNFIVRRGNLNTLNMSSRAFIETFFGKMLHENFNLGSKYNDEVINTKDKLDKVLEDSEIFDTDRLNATKDLTTGEFKKEIINYVDTYKQKDLLLRNIINNITSDIKKQDEILEAVENYMDKTKNILLNKDTDMLDTLHFVRYANHNMPIQKFTLFNIYMQFLNKKTATAKEEFAMAEELANEISKSGFKMIGNKKLHTALIDVQATFKVIENIIDLYKTNKNIFKDTKLTSMKNNLVQFMNPKNRKKYIVIDTENDIDQNSKNRMYEISYMMFDEDGNPNYKQHFLKADLNKQTIEWLKSKGYTSEDIIRIKSNQTTADFKHNQKVYAEVLEDLKDKRIIGQNITKTEYEDGDVEKINKQIKLLYENEVTKVIRKNNDVEREVINKIETLDLEKMSKEIKSLLRKDNISRIEILSEISKIYKMTLRKFLTDQYLTKDEVSPKEVEIYTRKITAIGDLFKQINPKSTIKKEIENIFKNDINDMFSLSKKDFNRIYTMFENHLNEKINKGYILTKLPKLVYDEQNEMLKLDEQEIDAPHLKIEFNPYDDYSNFMFRNAAFNEIIPVIKEIIKVKGLSLGEYDYMHHTISGTELNDIESISSKVDYNIMEAEKALKMEDFEAYTKHKYQAIKEVQKQNHRNLVEDAFIDSELFYDIKKAEEFFSSKEGTKVLTSRRVYEIQRAVNDFYNKEINNIIKKDKFEYPEEYKIKLEAIYDRLSYQDIQTITNKGFSEVFNFDETDPLTYKLYRTFKANYQNLKTNGYEITNSLDNSKTIIPYNHMLENDFKKFAILEMLKDESNGLKIMLGGKDLTFNSYKNKEFEQQKKEILRNFERTTNQNEFNKQYFSEERTKIQNLILNSEWNKLIAYINKGPKNGNYKALRTAFEKKLKELKKSGIALKKYGRVYNQETKSLDYYKETNNVIHYNENNENIKKYFIRETIQRIKYDIDRILYIEKYRTTMEPENDFNGILSYQYYKNNLEDFDGDYVESDFKKHNKDLNEIKEAYEYMDVRQNKMNDLSSYQLNFYDMIEPFRIPNTNKYDIDRLWKEINEGYLSRIYEITVLSDVTETEKQTISDYNKKRSQEFQKGLPKKIAELEKEIETLKAEGKLEDIKILEERIVILKETKFLDNQYYKDEKINEIRRKYTEWDSDEEIFKSIPGAGNFLDNLKNTPHPTLKTIQLANKRQLEYLITAGKDLKSLGFTSLVDLFSTNKISYNDYRLPKSVAFMQNSILKFQKAMMLMNMGFVTRNIYDGFVRNHQLVVGTDDLINENYRFMKEAARTYQVGTKYSKYQMIHFKQMEYLEKTFHDLDKIISSKNIRQTDLEQIIQDFKLFTTEKIESINRYLKNIIEEQGQTNTKRASSNYVKFSSLARTLSQINSNLNKKIIPNEDFILTLQSDLEQMFKIYNDAGFFEQVIMNNFHKDNRLNFDDNSKENKQKITDELNMMRLINEIEKSGVIADRYEVSGKSQAKEIYKKINERTNEEYKRMSLSDIVDKIINSKANLIGVMTSFTERFQRIHGILLDMYYNGKTKDRALNESLFRFFNYGMKSAYEKSASVYFPFLSFALRNLDYYLDMFTDQRYVRYISNVAQGMATWYDDDDENDYRNSNSFSDFTENQGWIPLGKNFGVKIGNASFDAMSLIDDPFNSTYQKLNPILQQLNNMTKKEQMDFERLPIPTVYNRASKSITSVLGGPTESPADFIPSLFYRRYENTPYSYRTRYGDYRNVYKDLFYMDGARRVQSKNAFTLAKNIRYQRYRNYMISRNRRR